MKQLLTLMLACVTASGPVGPAVAEEPRTLSALAKTSTASSATTSNNLSVLLKPGVKQVTFMAKQAQRTQRLRANAVAMDRAIKKLKKHVGKTWYVFSGSTPSGWDCSGLVRWTYEQVGIELEHSATKQANAGRIVKHPLPGDIVAYQYQKGKSYYHVGIYVGNGMTIQALRNKTRTMLVRADSPVVGFNKPVYIRILDRDGSTPASRAKAAATLPAN